MFPTLTPFPPDQPHQHYPAHDVLNQTPYDLNDPTFLSRNDPTQSFPNPSRSRLQLPHPVQLLDPRGGSTSIPINNATAEHALRRKTPNGTLAAGYDGTPVDTTIQPATKHLLVSPIDSGMYLSTQAGRPMENWHQPTFDTTSSKHMNFPPVFKNDGTNALAAGEVVQDVNGTSWVRTVNYPLGMDSVLNQNISMQAHQRVLFHNGAYIPTVLPATLQPCDGPTASAGSGPFGPYWPDGAYIPYRPVAFRDARFESPIPAAQPFFDANQRAFNQPHISLDSRLDTEIWTQGHPGISQTESGKTYFPPRHSDQLPFHTRINRLASSYSSNPHINEPISWAGHPYGPGFQPSGSSVVANVEFKEKILSWAHGVYVDLLATIHQARRNSMSNGPDGQNPRFLKPSIYPKPPRQPGLDFSHTAPNMPRHNSYPSIDLQRQKVGISSNIRMNDSFDHQSDVYAKRPTLNQLSHHHRGSDSQIRTGRISHPRSIFNEGSPVASAVSALEMLSHLCMESRWEWVDGILLGGCLAYGLGDYHKAMRWYSRIIARDSTHVEAISNLAATLLALDRREEALQNWLRAVKLRPSFFEAVEHLIGLLCSSHRGKEAVSIIDFVQTSLRHPKDGDCFKTDEHASEPESDAESNVSDVCMYDNASFDYEDDLRRGPNLNLGSPEATTKSAGYATSGYSVPGSDNGRILALVHAKGNMLYALGENTAAAAAFEDAVLIAAGRRQHGMQGLMKQIFAAFSHASGNAYHSGNLNESILLYPDRALQTSKLVFRDNGTPPGLKYVVEGTPRNAAISTTSNSLLSLAKIYQDGMSTVSSGSGAPRSSPGVRDILALYYLSLSLQPSPSTANNVGILLAGIQNNPPARGLVRSNGESQHPEIPGVVPGSGISLALAYYNYGLHLDSRHAHLYTNLGSLLKDIGQLQAAIKMYEQAVQCDGNFDIALANLANAVKDAGKVNDAITYYKRAVRVNPEFAEAVCGLANALNSVCNWAGRGGITNGRGFRDRWHVDDNGMLRDSQSNDSDAGWIKRVVNIVDRQLREGEYWGRGLLTANTAEQLCAQLAPALGTETFGPNGQMALTKVLQLWAGKKWEGSRIVRLVERANRSLTWQWYQDRYVHRKEYPTSKYRRPQLPASLTAPNAPTVLPFHTFTCPLSAKQIRQISQRNGLRISCSTLRAPWLPSTVYRPPAPPNPCLRIGYVSSDFNNHPLAHLMQSVFGLHNPNRAMAYCYATTGSDKSIHRQQIEKEAPVFHDASAWSVERLVQQIVDDGIHILINLNGYTRGARNEVFAARPAPIHMSFMGFAGTLGAEWCDYILADQISIPQETLSPLQRTSRIENRVFEDDNGEDLENWVYGEKIVFTRDTFFCCDHRQSAPDAGERLNSWDEEQLHRWRMRKELFPKLSDDTIILGNFNQLYKIEPTIFRTWLRILAHIPNAVLWLLRFPETGEQNLRDIAKAWAGDETASRIIFTDVAPKNTHIARAKVLDLFLDTPECNAHTTATDVLWSGTPLLTLPRYSYKMCSRMASSILSSALPSSEAGQQARKELIASSDEDYENKAIRLCMDLQYVPGGEGRASGRLAEMRQMLFLHRYKNKLFDTARWVHNLEDAYDAVWAQWVNGEEGDIWL
ncbi:hypothetical protein N7495_004987 [Penicillium taxi]|uniref:uncharacterized protein n=1 Tax=Penicillium taxi TaxID=168475 RepID=UPI002545A538|nr:uncharacterized protein N7495_004987 [Penicillium taxi]KAJ5893296.1 hypothetical protein N7495_004987 [Penicillium taxi]